MIHRIEIENFRSIRERQIIDLTVGAKVPSEPGRLEPIFDGAERRAPRVVAIYGANASGKTNLLHALNFVGWFVSSSFAKEPGGRLPYEKFFTREMEASPTRFEIHFSGPANLKKPEGSPTCLYKYELVLGPRDEGQADRVLSESVKFRPEKKGRFRRVFERNEKGHVSTASEMKLGSKNPLLASAFQRPDASIISIMIRLNHDIAQAIGSSIGWVTSNLRVPGWLFGGLPPITPFAYRDQENLDSLNHELRRADFGIEEAIFEREERSKNTRLEFKHRGLDKRIDFLEESSGTIKFMNYFHIFNRMFIEGGLAVIDEIDASLHPLLMREIPRWFADDDRNRKGIQLWMSCQDPTLFDDLLKEEIVLCDKNSQGASEIYGLKEIDGVRRDENFKDVYLIGAYGGVPQYG
ncbi:AAA family ATPase [Thioalkalivibrio sp. HK1]|uniref:AAA family ATPase n=1 Tax=Thioalkalivibrio sp. HK1 TaxID=1469245 RepID=UPI00046EF791|nr:ATP-binding protein [Thioalkalivibrio sp. HK1]